MAHQTILVATNNSAKLAEIRSLLGDINYNVVSLADVGIEHDVEETGKTFEENALLKATTYSAMSGLLTLADDSGLEVKALHGEPGINTNRYAGPDATDEEKVQFLLNKMAAIPEGSRDARFTVYLALAWPSGKTQVVVGYYPGTIALEPRGKLIKKFPYRLIFIPKGSDKTLAELIEQGIPTDSPRTAAIAQIKEILETAKR